jgi:hypothetical protein
MTRPLRFLVPHVLLAVSACEGDRAPETVEATQLASLQETTVCTASELIGACRGPWLFRRYTTPCYNQGSDPGVCGGYDTVACTKYPICLHQELGQVIHKVVDVSLACTLPGCLGSMAQKCTQAGQSWYDVVKGNKPSVTLDAHLIGTPRIRNEDGVNVKHQDCDITLGNVRSSESPDCGAGYQSTCQVAKTCRSPAFGEAPKGACGSETIDRASAAGLGLAALQQAEPYLDPATAVCSTLEDVPLGPERAATTVARLAPEDPFWAQRPASAEAEAAARATLAREAKLLYELLGDTVSDATRAQLEDVYDEFPHDEPACGVSGELGFSATCQAWGASKEANGPLARCQRLLGAHVAQGVFDLEKDTCLALLAHPVVLASDPCAAGYRARIEEVAERLLARDFAQIQRPDLETRRPGMSTTIQGIDPALARIETWYEFARDAFADDPVALQDAVSRVLAAFWKRVYTVIAPAPTAFPEGQAGSEAARAALASFFAARLDADREVLAAAFSDPAPLHSRPLLYLVSDAFATVDERLRAMAPLYDLACRYHGNCTVAQANPATRMVRLLGSIANADEMAAALDDAGALGGAWLDVFTAIDDRRDALLEAYRDATGRPGASLDELLGADVTPAASGLAQLVARYHGMWAAYAGHGQLLPADGTLLKTGLQDAKRTQIAQQLVERVSGQNGLMVARQSYQKARGDFANVVLQQIASNQYQARLASQIAQAQLAWQRISHDLEGLLASEDRARAQLGSFMASFVARAAQPGWLPDYPIASEPMHNLHIAATEARGTREYAAPEEIAGLAVRPAGGAAPWNLSVEKGDLLTVDVGGVWAPTCALRATSIAGPDGAHGFADAVHTQTGPEGFSVTWDNGHFTAHEYSSSESDFSSETTTASVCGSIKASVPGSSDATGAGLSASACREWQTGHTETSSTSDSSGQKFSESASFAGGLRLRGTPFPTFPGGALILVEVVDPASGKRIRDAHVVRRSSTFLFSDAATLYLVVNDKSGCDTVDTSELSLNYVRSRSAADASKALVATMADVLTSLHTDEATYVKEGAVTATELAALASAAYDKLRTACHGCNLDAYPAQVRGMFDAWLNVQLASLERKTRVVAARRALDDVVLGLAALADDLAGQGDTARLLGLMGQWQLANLAVHELQAQGQLVLEYADEYVFPMLRIRYPQALALLRSSSTQAIEAVRQLDWAAPYDEAMAALESLSSAIAARLQQATLLGTDDAAPVMLMFPKPGLKAADAPLTDFNVADPDTWAGVWEPCKVADAQGNLKDDYCVRRHPFFQVLPKDVYADHQVGRLFCNEAAPVIRSMAIYALNSGSSSNTAWNANPHRRSVKPTADVAFPIEEGQLGFRVDNPQLAGFGVRVIAGIESAVWSTFSTFAAADHDAEGLSLFGSFTADLGNYVEAAPITTAKAVVLVFDVETRGALGPLAGLAACQGGTP